MKNKTNLLIILMSMLILLGLNTIGYAQDISSMTQQATVITNTTENVTVDTKLQDQQNGAAAVGEMFKQAVVDEESVKKANEKLRPIAEFMNFVNAIIVGLVAIFLFTVTALDLAYIAIPIIRPFLDGGQGMAQAGGMVGTSGGMGMGGIGNMSGGHINSGYDGIPGYGLQQPQGLQPQGVQTAAKAGLRLISDEAITCINNSQTLGSVIMSYMKKRAFFLIAFGVCVVIFTTSVFTDLGVKIGMVMLSWLTSLM